MKRKWTQARQKITTEHACRACGTPYNLEAAHIAGRVHDKKPPIGWQSEWNEPYLVHPNRIIPLCGPSLDTDTCHGKDTAHRLDKASLLTEAERNQAIADIGSEALMLRTMNGRAR